MATAAELITSTTVLIDDIWLLAEQPGTVPPTNNYYRLRALNWDSQAYWTELHSKRKSSKRESNTYYGRLHPQKFTLLVLFSFCQSTPTQSMNDQQCPLPIELATRNTVKSRNYQRAFQYIWLSFKVTRYTV